MHIRIPIAIAVLTASALQAQPCKPSAELEADRAKQIPGEDGNARFLRQRNQFPNDYFAHESYLASQRRMSVSTDSVREEYKALRNQHPGDPVYETAYADALVGTKTPDAIPILEGVLAKTPTFAPALLKLVEIYASTSFKNPEKMAARAEAYWNACPDQLTVFNNFRRAVDPAFAAKASTQLRKQLTARSDKTVVYLYSTLWSLEFQSTTFAEQGPVRDRIREDAKRIRGEGTPKDSRVLVTLQDAYKLVDDDENQKWATAELAKQPIRNDNSPASAIMTWHREHPSNYGYSKLDNEASWRKQTNDWIRRWPDDVQVRQERFQALDRSSESSLDDRVAAAEDWIRVYENGNRNGFSPYFQVAQYYSRVNTRYAELPGLVEKGLGEDQNSAGSSNVSDLYSGSSSAAAQQQITRLNHLNSAIEIYTKIGVLPRARELLEKLSAELPSVKPSKDSPEFLTPQYKQLENQYWRNRSTLAEAQHKPDEYLEAEREALRSNPWGGEPNQYQVNQLRTSWKQIKGSDAAFDEWFGPMSPSKSPLPVVSGPVTWHDKDTPMAEFSLVDTNGKNWRLKSLNGKVTLVNFWATWCGPCKEELPFVQHLYERLEGRKDLQVITLNTDENPGLIAPFLKQNKYTFPVLPASAYAERATVNGIPLTWLVDKKASIRKEHTGFGLEKDKDTWADRMIAEMEKVASTK